MQNEWPARVFCFVTFELVFLFGGFVWVVWITICFLLCFCAAFCQWSSYLNTFVAFPHETNSQSQSQSQRQTQFCHRPETLGRKTNAIFGASSALLDGHYVVKVIVQAVLILLENS